MFSQIKGENLKLSELFKLAVTVYKKYFGYFAVITAFIYVPFCIILELFPKDLFLIENLAAQNIESLGLMPYGFIGVYFLFIPLETAAITIVSKHAVEGKELKYTDVLDNTLLKWFKLCVTSGLLVLILGVSAILIVLPMFLYVSFQFYANIVAITDKWGFSALRESHKLVKGKWLKTFLYVTLILIVSFIASFMLNLIYALTIGNVIAISRIVFSVVIEMLLVFFKVVVSLYFLNLFYLKNADIGA